MEKYSAWRDKETGIHPFFHPKPKVARVFFRPLIDLFIAMFRVCLLVIVFPVYGIVAWIFSLIPLPGLVGRGMMRIVHGVGCRLLLFILGFWSISTSFQRLSRKNALPTATPGRNISSGDLIICNKQSVAEILYLGFRFAPTFTAISIDGKKIKEISIFQAIVDSMNLRRVYKPDGNMKYESIQAILARAEKNRSGPVVVFPEGISSNGKGLLDSASVLSELEYSEERTHVIGFKYDWQYFCPSYTVGNRYYHIYRMCGQVKNSLVVKYLSPNDIPRVEHGEEKINGPWSELIFQSLAHMLRLKRTKLNQQDFQDFLDYWDESNKKAYTKKKLY